MNKTERRIETDRKIKHSAIEVFAEKGYERSKLCEIAKRAGVTGGLIVQNFGGKLELLKTILDEESEYLHEIFDSVKSSDWKEHLKALLGCFKRGVSDNSRRPYFVFIVTMSNSKDTPPYYIEKAHDEFNKSRISKYLLLGQERGELQKCNVNMLYALFFRTACNVVLASYRFNINIPDDDWFLNIIRER